MAEYFNVDLIKSIHVIRTIIILVIVFLVFSFLIKIAKKKLLKRAKTKKQKSNVAIFSKLLRYLLFLVLIVLGISTYAGSWAGLGIGVALLSGALGWALQRPITGIAAWIMVITRRPFEIGDRIIIGKVRGDVKDISLTHICVAEIGGIYGGEENSGRIVMIPNSILFEQNITNYTSNDDFILSQVTVRITYSSNLDKAMKTILNATKKVTKEFIEATGKEPYIRIYFQPSYVDVNVRYSAPAKSLQEVSTNVSKEIFKVIKKAAGVEIAHPHTDVVIKKKR